MVGPEFLSREEWIKVAKRSLASSNFDLLNWKTKNLSEGCGFLGEHRLVEVTVRLHDAQKTQRTLRFFVKAYPQNLQNQKELAEETGTFKKEVDAVSKLFAVMRSALEDGGKDMEWHCRCFYTRPDVLVLEDLAVQGFRVVNTRIDSKYQHCAAVLKVLANLHSASLIFEEKQPTQPYSLGKEYADILFEGFFKSVPNHPGDPWLKTSEDTVVKLIETIRGRDYLSQKLSQINEAMKSLFEYVKTSGKFRNTVGHGDMWRNNMFFRHENDEPVEARLVDFQTIRYTPPANDVMCFLHLTSTRSFRTRYESQLLAYYHDQLSRNLRRHGLDPDAVLPWKEFKESCEYYKKLGVLVACCYCPVILISEDDFKHVLDSSTEFERFLKIDRTPEVLQGYNNDCFYRSKVDDVIKEFIDVFLEK